MTGVLVLVAALTLAGVAGFALKARNGRITRSGVVSGAPALPERVRAALDPGAAVTLVQISTTFCAPCRHAKALLSHLADTTEGLRHVDLDVTETPEVATGLGVLRTPTTLALTPAGAELLRVGGVPKKDDLLAALRPHLP